MHFLPLKNTTFLPWPGFFHVHIFHAASLYLPHPLETIGNDRWAAEVYLPSLPPTFIVFLMGRRVEIFLIFDFRSWQVFSFISKILYVPDLLRTPSLKAFKPVPPYLLRGYFFYLSSHISTSLFSLLLLTFARPHIFFHIEPLFWWLWCVSSKISINRSAAKWIPSPFNPPVSSGAYLSPRCPLQDRAQKFGSWTWMLNPEYSRGLSADFPVHHSCDPQCNLIHFEILDNQDWRLQINPSPWVPPTCAFLLPHP